MVGKVNSMKEKSHLVDFMNYLFREHPEYKNGELFAIKSSYEQHNDHLFEALTKIIKLFSDLEECRYFQNVKESIVILQKIHTITEKKNEKIKKSEFKEYIGLIKKMNLEQFEECQWVFKHWAEYKDWKTSILTKLQIATKKFEQIANNRNDVQFNQRNLNYVEFIRQEVGFEGPLKSVKDFFLLMKKFRQWMNSFKISLAEWKEILDRSFVFEVEWVKKAEDEGRILESKLEEFKSEMQNEF